MRRIYAAEVQLKPVWSYKLNWRLVTNRYCPTIDVSIIHTFLLAPKVKRRTESASVDASTAKSMVLKGIDMGISR